MLRGVAGSPCCSPPTLTWPRRSPAQCVGVLPAHDGPRPRNGPRATFINHREMLQEHRTCPRRSGGFSGWRARAELGGLFCGAAVSRPLPHALAYILLVPRLSVWQSQVEESSHFHTGNTSHPHRRVTPRRVLQLRPAPDHTRDIARSGAARSDDASGAGAGARPCRKGKTRPSASTDPDAEVMRVAKAPGTREKGKPARPVPTSEPCLRLRRNTANCRDPLRRSASAA